MTEHRNSPPPENENRPTEERDELTVAEPEEAAGGLDGSESNTCCDPGGAGMNYNCGCSGCKETAVM